ncbi:MAG: helix-turn-helix domain-containing protein [Methanolobus sp.]
MHELYKGENKQKRFNELKNKLQDVTPKTLSTRLKELEEYGLVDKNIDDSVFPIKSEYSLTQSGEEFRRFYRISSSGVLNGSLRTRNVVEPIVRPVSSKGSFLPL